MRDVVITGMGLVCPLGVGVEHVWRQIVEGRGGISAIQAFDTSHLPCRIAGQVPHGRAEAGGLDLAEWLSAKEIRRGSRFAQLAQVAAAEALADAGWPPRDELARGSTGVVIGTGCGGMGAMHQSLDAAGALQRAARSPAALRGAMLDHAACQVATRFGFGGPRLAVSTACASGAHAIIDAARLIMLGDADVMLAGGAEAAVCDIGIAGFCAARALSTGFNDEPWRASRPWDRDRDGFVMAEGAGMVVLEEREHARRRGAVILAALAGYGMTSDAHHVTAPAEGHEGAWRAMRNALRAAKLRPEEVGYVNAHGTSTPLGDDLELAAVERLFGDAARGLAMSSTKSATGHMLGAAGAAEAIFCARAMREGTVPPTLNLDAPSRASPIDRVARVAQRRRVRAAMSNSFGFGGTNAAIVLRAA